MLVFKLARQSDRARGSFDHGVREGPGSRLTHNDWDLQYGNGGDFFDVSMVAGDSADLSWLLARKTPIPLP